MARVANSNVNFRGTIGELTYVKRGKKFYVRRKRGTVKKAVINEKLQAVVDRNAAVNRTAVPINNILSEYAGKIKEGAFWQRLLSRIRKCANDKPETHLQNLANLELHEKHKLIEHVSIQSFTIKVDKDHFTISLPFGSHSFFRNPKKNCYYYELIVILFDKNGEVNTHDSVPTHWVYHSDQTPEYAVDFKRTRFDKYYLFALKVNAGCNGQRGDGMGDLAMAILGGGILK